MIKIGGTQFDVHETDIILMHINLECSRRSAGVFVDVH